MNMRVTAPYMGSTDVDRNNDFASESVGVDREQGLWVITADGEEIRFSLEVQQEIADAIETFLSRLR